MKILMVNKFHYVKGGSETYYFALKRELEREGHTIVDFSMKDPKNFTSSYEQYFVENVDYGGYAGVKSKLKMAMNVIFSFEAKKKFEALVIREKPDLIHLHIFQHQISPSILDIVKKYNIPAVYTAHDLKMICLNYKMMHHGKVCELCKNGHYFHCALNRCVKESFSKSCINVIEGYLHKWRKSYDIIDYVITPSEFYRRKFIEFGIDSERIVHIPNFLDRDEPYVNKTGYSKFLYFGRLSEEKGILTLIKAAAQARIELNIVGTGPLKEQLELYIEENNLYMIHILGFKYGQELTDLVGNARAVILPSEWYENGPYSAIEALQLGCPLIGADIGGIPELIGKNGLLFSPRDIKDLAEKLIDFNTMDSERYNLMREASKELYRRNYIADVHMPQLLNVYQRAIKKKLERRKK